MPRNATRLSVLVGILFLAPSIEAQTYSLILEDQAIPAEGEFTVDVILDSQLGVDMNGWAFGVCQTAGDLNVSTVALAERVLALHPSIPWFFNYNMSPDGYTVGVILNRNLGTPIPPSIGPIQTATYTHSLSPGDSTSLSVCDTLGNPTVTIFLNPYFAPMITEDPALHPGQLTVLPSSAWIRGDANDDGVVDVADGVFLMNELFLDGPEGTCFAAKDVNSDEILDLSDAVDLFSVLFLSAPPPASPWPECGFALGDCAFQESCP